MNTTSGMTEFYKGQNCECIYALGAPLGQCQRCFFCILISCTGCLLIKLCTHQCSSWPKCWSKLHTNHQFLLALLYHCWINLFLITMSLHRRCLEFIISCLLSVHASLLYEAKLFTYCIPCLCSKIGANDNDVQTILQQINDGAKFDQAMFC